MDFLTIVSFTIFLCATILATIPLIWEVRVPKNQRRNKPFYKTVTNPGKWFLAISIFSIALVGYKVPADYYADNDKNRRIDTLLKHDSLNRIEIPELVTKNNLLVGYNKFLKTKLEIVTSKVDTANGLLRKVPQINYKAVLTLVGVYGTLLSNPSVTLNPSKDNLSIKLLIKNVGNTEATIINDENLLVQYLDNRPVFDANSVSHISNKTATIYPDKSDSDHTQFSWSYNGVNKQAIKLSTPSFIYFRINYLYSKNQYRSFVKIFSITENLAEEASPEWYNRVEKDLRAKHLW